jgi:hypothetical protein
MTGPDGKRYQVADLIKEDIDGPLFQIHFIYLSSGEIQSSLSSGNWYDVALFTTPSASSCL